MNPTWNLWHGDCRDMLKEIPENSVDAAVLTPPSPLGLLGYGWNRDALALSAAFWWQIHRVLKPGAYASVECRQCAYHKIACAAEDGGFLIADHMTLLYSGAMAFFAQKPLSEATVHLNEAKWGVGRVRPSITPSFEPHIRIAPPSGTILDPFARGGEKGARYFYDGFSVLLAERDRYKVSEIETRMAAVAAVIGA